MNKLATWDERDAAFGRFLAKFLASLDQETLERVLERLKAAQDGPRVRQR